MTSNAFHRFLQSPPTEASKLAPSGSWREAAHRWSREEMRALAAAAFSGRPLLVKGEPGTGKSQIARAAAKMLEWRFEYEVITPALQAQDLLWRFDAVRRLADAGAGRLLDERAYAIPGALWRAIDPHSSGVSPDETTMGGCVLLLDEIDKADSDLPNSLLEVLGNRSFKTSFDGKVGTIPSDMRAQGQGLLIVISSNDERELPLAFMRRCVVLELKLPDETADPDRFVSWLVERGSAQFDDMNPDLLLDAARLVCRDRALASPGQGARPGLAEYIDLLRALDEIVDHKRTRAAVAEQKMRLREISPYMLRKQAGQDQSVEQSARDQAPEPGS